MKKLLFVLILPVCASAMDLKQELIQAAGIGLGSAAAAYAYSRGAEWLANGINSYENSQLNINIARGRPGEIHTHFDKWGALGSWWIGLPLIAAARIGSNPLDVRELIKPMAITYGATAGVSLAAGIFAALRAPQDKRDERSIIAAFGTAFITGTVITPPTLIGYILYQRIAK